MADKMLRKRRSAKRCWVAILVNEGNLFLSNDQLTLRKLQSVVEDLKAKCSNYLTTHDLVKTKLRKAEDDDGCEELKNEHGIIETKYREELQRLKK